MGVPDHFPPPVFLILLLWAVASSAKQKETGFCLQGPFRRRDSGPTEGKTLGREHPWPILTDKRGFSEEKDASGGPRRTPAGQSRPNQLQVASPSSCAISLLEAGSFASGCFSAIAIIN